MTIAQIMERMLAFSEGNIHDIDHLLRVWSYAKTIGELEDLDHDTQFILEAAAIVHDIACPLCREKYGSTNGKYQEREGEPMVRAFFADSDLSSEQINRIAWLVAHHHTFCDIQGIDYQILVEADYIANASENTYSRDNIKNFLAKNMKTESAIRLTKLIFQM